MLELGDGRSLFWGNELNGDNTMGLIEAEHIVEEGDEDVFVFLGAKNALKGKVGFGVGKGGSGAWDSAFSYKTQKPRLNAFLSKSRKFHRHAGIFSSIHAFHKSSPKAFVHYPHTGSKPS